MYICICKSITDSQIRAAAENGDDTIHKLKKKFGLASSCGSCVEMTESILQESVSKRAKPILYIPSAA